MDGVQRIMAFDGHQTQIDLDIDTESPSTSPVIIPKTPPQQEELQKGTSRLRTASRNLLPSLSQAQADDLANQPPLWYKDFHQESTPEVDEPTRVPYRYSTYSSSSGSCSSSSTSSSMQKAKKKKQRHRDHSSTGSTPLSTMSSSSNDSDLLRQILKEVQNSNEKFQDKITQLEKKIDDMQEKPKGKRKKITPSPEVRDMVRKIYRVLSEESDQEGCEWDLEGPLTSDTNQEVLKRVVSEVKTHLSDTPSAVLKEAARTYFQSLVGTARMKGSGQYKKKCAQQRKKNRLSRKLMRRQAALAKTAALTQEQKEQFSPCLVMEVMSSEESDTNEEYASFTVRPLPWRHDKIGRLFVSLDKKAEKNQSKRSKLMSFSRVQGLPSDRPKPDNVPGWVFKK